MSTKKSKHSQLDPESQKFIKWAFKQIRDDESLVKIIHQFTDEAANWLLENISDLRTKLKEKMVKGVIEHGSPIHTTERLEEELIGERLDLIGWGMVKKYNKKLQKKK